MYDVVSHPFLGQSHLGLWMFCEFLVITQPWFVFSLLLSSSSCSGRSLDGESDLGLWNGALILGHGVRRRSACF
ncbi:unnamed protein product [Citrullus colocynthis]|uniref:Uncharacterized protein n=1 Tax=Citrullus colocynthis TaxID=252529 RepID=A0ABP0Y6T5_9ROSI